MEDIKRYKDYEIFKLLFDIDERPVEVEHIDELGAKQKLFKNHCDLIRSDHKAVVESKYNRILELETALRRIEEKCDMWKAYGKPNQCIDYIHQFVLSVKGIK